MSATTQSPATLEHEVILASAGSGKTWQLTTRFLELLVAGVPPEHVLATTFTRKAAGEIFTRLLARLLAAHRDAQALADLNAALELPPERALDRERCLRLLAGVVRTLDRFQVRTLDAFFADLAGLFGLDLGLPPGWSVVEEVDDLALRGEAVGAALAGAPAAELAELLSGLHGGRPRRSVHEALMQAVKTGYAIWLDSDAAAWERALRPLPDGPAGAGAEELALVLARLTIPLTKSGTPASGFVKVRDKLAAHLEAGDWKALLKETVVQCVVNGSNTFSRVPLDGDWIEAMCAVSHQAGRVLGARLLQRSRAQRRLLERFHGEYARLQRERRAYRFDDLPRALAVGGLDLAQPAAAFRLGRSVEHLLLDEFQDTSVLQWRVLAPLAEAIVRQPPGRWSLLCVGDVKQAIYGWRDGESRLLQSLYDTRFDGHATRDTLRDSYRSSPVVLGLVNTVFSGLASNPVFADDSVLEQAAERWGGGFQSHRPAKPVAKLPGAARLIEVPLAGDKPDKTERTAQLMAATAEHVRVLLETAPRARIAVLLRRREPSARLLRELRQRGVLASGEGGNALTDAETVRLALSLLQLADHPGDTAARFHLATSPLGGVLGLSPDGSVAVAADFAARVRAQVHERGFGEWLAGLERHVLACGAFDAWEHGRFRQLVELGLAWDARPGSRLSDFVEHVRLTRVEDPSSARVRVMTVHGAKGLEFDAVVLPDLDEALVGRGGELVTVRPDPAGKITAVFPRPSAELCAVLPELAQACEHSQQRALEESLCVLYVALTRARRRLDLLVPAAYSGARRQTFARLLRHALLGAEAFPPAGEDGVLWTQPGSADAWWPRETAAAPRASQSPPPAPCVVPALTWSPSGPRTLPRRSPSRLEGGARITASELLSLEGGAARGRGLLVHRWLEALEWIEGWPAGDETLLAAGADVARREGFSAADQRARLAELRGWLARPATRALFAQQASRQRLGLDADATLAVQRERRFAVADEPGLLVGSMDRVVLAARGGAPIAAEIIDYKTDRLDGAGGAIGAIDALVEHYRPQMQAYRRALCALTGLPPERVACRLLFLERDEIREV